MLSLQNFALKHCFKFFFGLPLVFIRFFPSALQWRNSPLPDKSGYGQVTSACVVPGDGGGGGVGYSEFQVTGMIEYGQRSKLKKNPRASNKTQKVPEPKINPPKNPVRNFRALIIAKCNVVHIKQLQNKFGCILFAEQRRWDTRALPRILS